MDASSAVSIWWYQYAWLVLGGVLLITVASLAARRWGTRLREEYLRGRFSRRDTAAGRWRQTIHRVIDVAVRLLGNIPLLAGTAITTVVVVAYLAPQLIAPYGPDERGRTMQIFNGRLIARPFPPSQIYPLGTDDSGRDMLSRIVHGTSRTVGLCLAVALFRLVIGGGLGAVAGWRGGALGHQILSFGAVSSSIPSLLFAFVFILAIGPRLGFGVFLLGMGLTGWAELTGIVSGAIRWIRAQPYMDSAMALGSSPPHILRRHVLPNLAPQLLPALALELSAVLLTLGELGFLGLSLGEPFSEYVPQGIREPRLAEWAGMLSGTRVTIFTAPWLPLAPAGAFLVTILGLNLLAAGLRGWMDPYQRRSTRRG